MNALPTSLPRRRLLTGSATALAAAGLASWSTGALAQAAAAKPLPAYLEGLKDASSLIVHSNNTLETQQPAHA